MFHIINVLQKDDVIFKYVSTLFLRRFCIYSDWLLVTSSVAILIGWKMTKLTAIV